MKNGTRSAIWIVVYVVVAVGLLLLMDKYVIWNW